MKIYAITGGIGCGKSSVGEIISSLSFPVLSCDKIVTEIYSSHSVKVQLRKMFPNCVKGKKLLKIDRKALAEVVFNDKNKKIQLESFIHPLVIQKAFNKLKNTGKEIGFIEVPLLFESKLENKFDGVIVVKRKLNDRIESVKKRSNLTEKEIMQRISNQFDYEKADLSKYIVIENFSNKKELENNVKNQIKKLIKE